MQAEYEAKLEAVALRKEDRPKVRGAPQGGLGSTGLQSPHWRQVKPCPQIHTAQVVSASRAVFMLSFSCLLSSMSYF